MKYLSHIYIIVWPGPRLPFSPSLWFWATNLFFYCPVLFEEVNKIINWIFFVLFLLFDMWNAKQQVFDMVPQFFFQSNTDNFTALVFTHKGPWSFLQQGTDMAKYNRDQFT